MRGYRRKASRFLGIGLVLLTFVFIAAYLDKTTEEELLDRGYRRVVGQVIEVQQDRMLVEFRDDGRPQRGTVSLGDSRPEYTVGDALEVFYDPSHSSRLLTRDDLNYPPVTVWPLIFMCSLFAGAGLSWAGMTMLVRRWRSRSLLSRFPWRELRYRLISRGRSGALIALDEPNGVRIGVFVPASLWLGPLGRFGRKSRRVVWVVGVPEKRMLLSLPGPANLMYIRPPRTERTRQRWKRWYG